MKTLFFFLTGFLSLAIQAQNLTLRFENSLKDYEVKIDGRSYFSNDLSSDTRTNKAKLVTINDLTTGTHRIDVYTVNGNNTNNAGASIYSNTFQLRDGYDLVIAIKRNEQVAFTERRSSTTTQVAGKNPMSETEFDKLKKSISAKWSQSARFASAKAAINTQGNYFTTEQAGQLVSLLTAESKKVELAKLAYPKVTDPNNFSEINSLFNSQAARDDMEKYIGSTTGNAGNPVTTGAAMPNSQFNSLMRTVRNQYQQAGKVAVLTDAFSDNEQYFSTAQLRQLISLVTAENDRLALAKLSYARVSDPDNFSSLSNLLVKQSSRDELNSFVKYGVSPAATETYANRVPLTDAEFRKLHQKAALHFRQSSVVADVRAAFSNTTNYYTIDQVRSLLGLVSAESDRLSLAKLAYHRAAEPQAFTQLFDLFSTEASKVALSNYISSVVIK